MPLTRLADQVKIPASEKVDFFINGNPVQAPEDFTVLQAARAHGFVDPLLHKANALRGGRLKVVVDLGAQVCNESRSVLQLVTD